METFGQKLRALREDAGMTRRQLEDETGISQRQIAYLEKDLKEPRRSTLESLASVLGPAVYEAAFPDIVPLRRRAVASAKGRYLRSEDLIPAAAAV